MNNYELYHHGILGQKWGVRRYQNEDGTLTEEGRKKYSKLLEKNTLEKGSEIYRVASTSDEKFGDSTYVTINKADRDFYMATGSTWIAAVQNVKVNDLYNNVYKLNKDIKIATSSDVADELDTMASKDKKLDQKCAVGVAEMKMLNQGYPKASIQALRVATKNNNIKTLTKELQKSFSDPEITDENSKAFLALYKNKCTDAYNNIINASNRADKVLLRTAGMGGDSMKDVKNTLINNLKSKGYNAMSDVAGIGGAAGLRRETNQATILFEADSLIDKVKSQRLTDFTRTAARRRANGLDSLGVTPVIRSSNYGRTYLSNRDNKLAL